MLLAEEQLEDTVIDIISEIKLITGALVYENEEMRAQVKMIRKFLQGSFGMLTKEEIIHAFYLNAEGKFETTFRHYNKELNAEFIGDVLRAYLGYKLYLRETKGPQITKILRLGPAETPREPIDYEFWKAIIQEEYHAYCRNLPATHMWTTRKYYTLRKFGLLPFKSADTWIWFLKKTMQGSTGGTKLPAGSDIRHFKFQRVSQIYHLFYTDEDRSRCIDYTRRYAYWYVLSACRQCGINNLWTEIANK